MQSLQFCLRSQWFISTQDNSIRINWTPDNLANLQWWAMESNLLTGKGLQDMTLDFMLYTDASTQSWGYSLLHNITGGLWSEDESAFRVKKTN
ncbi:hypothetical protein E2C01_053739 [Portunus trituberculatus]|uniref:Uncharacterized protein n=1 Tax=Portunus trituberculatus TaxID=210409 RepID=A0A5B7GL56_PORTR|nr:hypothetical protein [Portunus trituberculatus]